MTKKVFISYAWDDIDFSQKVLDFSNNLRKNGIDANIDQYEENPDMGWPIWMEQQIETADFVLVIGTKTYYEKFKQLQNGKGVSWEISSIYQSLYNLQGHNDKFIPVVFSEDDKQYIVKALQPYTIYNISNQFQKLVNRIKGIPNVVKPPIQEALPEKKAYHMFVSSPINLELWNKAQWKGVAFLYIPNCGNVLALTFEGDEQAATQIFKEWQNNKNLDDYIDICFIEGDIDELPPNGYTCLIGPNLNQSIKRATINTKEENILIVTINRFQRMYPQDDFAMYNRFKRIVKINTGKPVPIIPITLVDKKRGFSYDNLKTHFDMMIYTKNIRYIKASEIKNTDYECCVIPKFNKDFPKDWRI